MNLEWHFPTPIWWEDTDIDNTEMLNLCYKMQREDPEGRTFSNQGGWQSRDFRPDVYSEMKRLEDRILEQTQQCYRDYGYNQEAGFPVLENLWFNINMKGDTNSVHIHDNSFISGVYYLKAKVDQGNITFYKSFYQDYITVSRAPIAEHNIINSPARTFPPKTGKLIMFPGSLPHGVERNNTDEERVSISFNTKIVRTDDERYRTIFTK